MTDETTPPPLAKDRRDAPPADGNLVERAKFDLHGEGKKGEPSPALESAPLPWGYGADRITALVRSPDDLYVYWEVTDPGIGSARARLGPHGASGWLNL